MKLNPFSLPLWVYFLLAWTIAYFLAPFVIELGEPAMLSILMGIGIAGIFTGMVLLAAGRWGTVKTALCCLGVIFSTYAIEWLGISTGIPFGDYHYSPVWGLKIAGVPLLIPFTWCAMLFLVWGIAFHLLGEDHSVAGRIKFAALSGLLLVAWDFYIDPKMVDLGFWTWMGETHYFGFPWTNFPGWWITAFVITFLCRPKSIPWLPCLVIYTLIWISEATYLALFRGQFGSALTGFLAMGYFVFRGWAKLIDYREVALSIKQTTQIYIETWQQNRD